MKLSIWIVLLTLIGCGQNKTENLRNQNLKTDNENNLSSDEFEAMKQEFTKDMSIEDKDRFLSLSEEEQKTLLRPAFGAWSSGSSSFVFVSGGNSWGKKKETTNTNSNGSLSDTGSATLCRMYVEKGACDKNHRWYRNASNYCALTCSQAKSSPVVVGPPPPAPTTTTTTTTTKRTADVELRDDKLCYVNGSCDQIRFSTCNASYKKHCDKDTKDSWYWNAKRYCPVTCSNLAQLPTINSSGNNGGSSQGPQTVPTDFGNTWGTTPFEWERTFGVQYNPSTHCPIASVPGYRKVNFGICRNDQDPKYSSKGVVYRNDQANVYVTGSCQQLDRKAKKGEFSVQDCGVIKSMLDYQCCR